MKYKQHQPQVKNVGFGGNFHKRNQIGLDNAYKSDNKTYIKDNTMYVAGTSNLQDVFNDWVKIPLGLTRYSQRYQDADKVLSDNPQVNRIISHSLGSSVGLELEKRHPDRTLNNITYGAPVLQMNDQKHMRFRKSGDVISAFDKGAMTIGKGSFNPLEAHSYMGYD